jgi:hypothetical protein
MILRGILDDALGQLCIRGFANIKDLARISKANELYQRKMIVSKQQSIHDYFSNSEHAFFPEIILSFTIKHDATLKKQMDEIEPLSLLRQSKKFTSNVDRASFIVKEHKLADGSVKIAEAIIPDDIVMKCPFNRIDGNHRLSAIELGEMDRFDSLKVPFCIILQQEITQERFNPSLNQSEKFINSVDTKYEKLIFYNINAKSTPLTYEENLSAILSDDFSDEEITKTIGVSAVIVKKLKADIQSILAGYSGIKNIVSGSLLTICITLIKLLLENELFKIKTEGEQIESVKKAFEEINTIYNGNASIKGNLNVELFITFLYYASLELNQTRIKQFESWVCRNDLFKVSDTKAKDFINIFDQIFEHNIKIFVAMPYFNGNPEIVANYNRVYKEAIDDVMSNFAYQNIKLFEIMQHSGATIDILNNIFNQIKECSIFIADITEANVNVFYEYGYAKALNKDIIVFQKSDDTSSVPFDIIIDYRNPYSSDNNLKDLIIKNVSEILVKNYGLIKVSK